VHRHPQNIHLRAMRTWLLLVSACGILNISQTAALENQLGLFGRNLRQVECGFQKFESVPSDPQCCVDICSMQHCATDCMLLQPGSIETRTCTCTDAEFTVFYIVGAIAGILFWIVLPVYGTHYYMKMYEDRDAKLMEKSSELKQEPLISSKPKWYFLVLLTGPIGFSLFVAVTHRKFSKRKLVVINGLRKEQGLPAIEVKPVVTSSENPQFNKDGTEMTTKQKARNEAARAIPKLQTDQKVEVNPKVVVSTQDKEARTKDQFKVNRKLLV